MWTGQFLEALEYHGDSPVDLLFYLLALPWKLLFATVPPPRLAGGWLCFSIALVGIGGLTALIGAHTQRLEPLGLYSAAVLSDWSSVLGL